MNSILGFSTGVNLLQREWENMTRILRFNEKDLVNIDCHFWTVRYIYNKRDLVEIDAVLRLVKIQYNKITLVEFKTR